MRSVVLFAMVLVALAGGASAEDIERSYSPYFKTLFNSLHPGDHDALLGWENALARHLDYLEQSHGDADNLENSAAIRALVGQPRLDFGPDDELVGDWQVRSLQADPLGAYVYGWFPARIFYEAQALVFDKNSGSQRHRGLMARADTDFFIFAGALYYADEQPRLYSAHMDGEVTAQMRERDALAGLFKLAPDHYLMVFAPTAQNFRFYEIKK